LRSSGREKEALMADAVGLALLVVLDTPSPAERLAFVLHDLFAVPFEDIAPIVQRTPEAARQLASRARRRVRATANVSPGDLANQRAVVSRLLAVLRAVMSKVSSPSSRWSMEPSDSCWRRADVCREW
jgi:RNA polymerase sigma-70 factor (ECF subfamily)